jgi:RNA polymerase sigma-70 factor (ECF subfamily)
MRGHSAANTARRDYSAATPVPLRGQAEHLSDEALIALAARGDAKAVGEFYDRYGHVAYGLALRVLGDTESAEAVVEEAFAIVGRTNLAPSGTRASTWFLALVHRQAVERLRSTHPAGEARTVVDRRQTTGGDGWVGLQRERAQRALDQLTDAQREMLVLAYYEGLTVPELAARLDQRLEAVAATLHAGLSRLQNALAEEAMPIGAPAQAGAGVLRPPKGD